ncbi:HlyC/CorC family transporter [Hirschia maritima]|uniref:HlyC/CorC family transporter n=1 Tax=Hirschia maritima TaxID=1121961 RepID=UPI00037AE2D6|nr:HlyC/CorC family transporter [Hirschia maritima]
MNIDIGLVWPPIVVLILLMMSGFFSGSETALTAASRARMHSLEKEGKKGAKRVNKLIANQEGLIGSILLGNNLVNILATSIATSYLLQVVGESGVAVATMVMTILVLVFAEVLPKTYALNNADRFAMTVSGPIGVLVRLLKPLVKVVQVLVRITLAVFGIKAEADALAPVDEIRGAINMHAEDGNVEVEDKHRLGGVLDLKELTVEDVMVHRKSIVMIDADLPPDDVVRQALESPHTRLPLYRGDKEEIIGILHAKDLLRAIMEADGDFSSLEVDKIKRKAVFAPETTTLQDQLDHFQRNQAHFAIVVDEYGAIMGLITLEDILEEIVGEIRDEHDVTVEGVRPQPDGSVFVDGWAPIRDLNRAMDWDLPDDEAVTVAGLVIHETQTIPDPGRKFIFHGYQFEIMRKHRNQITGLRVRRDRKL